MRIYITSLVSLAAATFLLRRGENILQRVHKRCRMSSPRQKYAFAEAKKSRRGEVQISPRQESCAAAGTHRRRGENLTESTMFQTYSLAAASYIFAAARVFLAAAGILFRRGEDSTTLV